MKRVRWSIVLYGLFMALAAALYLTGLASSFAVVMLGAGSAGAILFGLRRYRPRLTRSWLMLALAVALNALARVLYAALPGTAGTLKPAAWVVWLVHLAMLVLFVAGIGGLARWAVRGATALIDTAIIALGVGLLFGVLIAIPYASTPDIGQVWAGVRVGYVVRDVLLVAVVVHLATAVRWTSSLALIVTGTAGLVGYDMLFRLGRIRGEYLAGTAIDLGWMSFYVALGAAALVPSMVAFDGPPVTTNGHQQPNGQTPRLRLGVVAAAALTPSAVLLISAFDPPRWFEPFIVSTVTLILVLALVRILDVTAQLRGQVRGERVSREAIAELADTHDAATVTAVLDRTVGELLEPGTDYRVAVEQQPGRVPDGPPADIVDTAKLPPGLGSTLGGRDATLVLALDQNPPKIEVPVRSIHDGPSLSDDAPAWALLVRATRADLERIRPRLLAARPAGRPRAGTHPAQRRDHPTHQRGVLPHARAEQHRRHPDPRRRQPDPVRQPVGLLRLRGAAAGRRTADAPARPGRLERRRAAAGPHARRRGPGWRHRDARRPRLDGALGGRAVDPGRGLVPGPALRPVDRGPGVDPAQRHRAARPRTRAGATGVPRPADRPQQPAAVQRAPGGAPCRPPPARNSWPPCSSSTSTTSR